MNILKPPQSLDTVRGKHRFFPVVFLGGSIEMGSAVDWQTRVTNDVSDLEGFILNPRRDDWDSSWEQKAIPGTPFYKQVDWEMEAQDISNIIVYWFEPGTKSPITLMELGKYIDSGKTIIVYCPEGFWRKGNVDFLCNRYGVETHFEYDSFITELRRKIALLQ